VTCRSQVITNNFVDCLRAKVKRQEMRIKGPGIVYPCECHKSKRGQISTVSLMWSALRSGRLITEGRALCPHWIWGWMDPTPHMGNLEKR